MEVYLNTKYVTCKVLLCSFKVSDTLHVLIYDMGNICITLRRNCFF